MSRNRRDPKREATWRKRFADWKASGIGAREFCRRRNLTETAFYFWRKELLRRDQEQPSCRKKVAKPKKLSFATIEMKTPLLSNNGRLHDDEIEIGFPNGRHIRFHQGISPERLKQVIHIVEATV